MIELLGAVGLGILALGGGAYALTHRRRREEEFVYDEIRTDEEPVVATAPVAPPEFAPAFFTGTPDNATLPPDRPLTSMPEDFDDSRFGRHVQAAYRGPTADNPSLSLKTRLKRAHFFDQRERMAGTQPAPSEETAEAMIAHARAARGAHDEEQPIFWPHDRRKDEYRPAFQS